MNKPLCFYNSFLRKILVSAILLLAPAANTLGTSRCPIGCIIWQHAVILESIWETDLTPYSSSDLPYFTPILPFTWTNYSKSKFLFPLLSLLGQIILSPTFFLRLPFAQTILSPDFRFSLLFLGNKF